MSRRTFVAGLAWLLLGSLVVAPYPMVAAAQLQEPVPQVVLYSPPVLTDVVDPFRPPAHIGAPGNRGLEYGDTDGDVVAAAADGWVYFAGSVAGRKTISIQHNDGVRTTYTGLLEIWVDENQQVSQYSAIAIAGGNLHFGARLKGHYLDPQILIDASEGEMVVRLVPFSDSG